MVFELLNTPLNFEFNNESHSIEIHQEIFDCDIMMNYRSIDGIELFDVSYECDFENSKFLLSDEIFTIYGTNAEGLRVQYNLVMSHSIDTNGDDIYEPVEFFQVR
jgi:hypothetical protein